MLDLLTGSHVSKNKFWGTGFCFCFDEENCVNTVSDQTVSISFGEQRKYVFILWLARVTVLFVCESWLPLIHVLVAYPMAGMFGRIDSCLKISLFLMMNNLCYVSIGSFLGAITSNVSIGMIVSTLVSQTSLLAAGFYTTLPPVINLLRYISPVTYTYTGILKSTFRSIDTYKCRSGGQSDVGVN